MSKLGNIQESYGKPITIAVANTYSSTVLASTALPKNALIITAPITVDQQGNVYDFGTYNMIMTDNIGNSVRLTYTIQQGNGLNIDAVNNDILKLDTDKNTFTTNDNDELSVNKYNIIDNSTLVVNESNKIQVNVDNLIHASADTLGVVKIDNETLKTTALGQMYVETENLDRANDNQYGVVTSDNNTVHIDSNGILSVNTQNLSKATAGSLGVIKIDGQTIKTNNDIIYVSTEDLTQASQNNMGVAKVDGSTLSAVSGVLSLNLNGLTHASNTQFGIVKFDNSIVIENGIASIKNYNDIFASVESEKTLLTKLQDSVNELKELILNNSFTVKGGIYALSCNDTTITNLIKPEYLEEPVNMKTQHVYVSMNIITDCDFNISVLYENNETPAVELSQINYNDEFSFQGYEGLLQTYPTTDKKQKRVILLFNCKNFKASAGKYEKTTKITITISSVKDKEIKKSLLYSIVRYNSNILVKDEENESINEKVMYIPVQSESYWKGEKVHVNNRRGYRNIEELEN